MSQTIDNRVVQLEFDNADFEKGVGESLSTLQKLKQNLNLEGASKALTALGAAASKFNLDPISNAVEQVGERFSYMKYAGLVAIENLVTAAMNAGSRMVSALTGPIMSGGWNRALNLEQANFMLNGLLHDADKVKAVMNDVSESVDGTAYSLDEAAKVAAQLTASNIQAGDEMLSALKAISGTAAMTNSTFEDIGSIFTTVAGQGKLMSYQLQQLSFRGLNAAATIGEQLGKTEAEVRDMVSKGKIDFKTFSDAMNAAFGEHAKEANNTFSGAMSNVRAALGRIGAEFATPFINNIIPVLNKFRLAINATKATMTPFFDAASVGMQWLSENVQKAIQGYTDFVEKNTWGIKRVFSNSITVIQQLYKLIKGITNPIKQAYRDIFPDKSVLLILKNVTDSVVSMMKKLNQLYSSSKAADTIKLAFKGFFSIFDTGKVIVTRIFDLLKQFSSLFDGFGGTITKVITKVSEFLLNVNQSIKDSDFLMYDLSGVVSKIQEIGDGIKGVFSKVKSYISDIKERTQGIREFFGGIFDNLKERVKDLLAGVKSLDVKGSLGKIFESIKGGFSTFWDYITGILSRITESLTGLEPTLSNIFSVISRLISSVLSGILKGVSGFLSSQSMSDLLTTLRKGAMLRYLWEFANSLKSLGIFIDNLNPKNLINSLTGLSMPAMDTTVISSIAKAILELAAAMLIMSLIDVDRFNMAVKALNMMFLEINATLVTMKLLIPIINKVGKAFTKEGKIWEDIVPDNGAIGTTAVIAGMAAAILILSVALTALSKIDSGRLAGSVIVVELLIATLVGAAVVITREVGKMAKNLALYGSTFKTFKSITKQLSKLLASITLAVLGLVVSLKILASIPATSMLKALVGLTVVMGALLGFCIAIQHFGLEKEIGPALLKIAVGLIAVAAALKIVSTIEPERLAASVIALNASVGGMVLALAALAGVIAIFNKMGFESLNFGSLAKSLLIVAVGLIAMAVAMKIMSTIEPDRVGSALLLLATGLGAMVAAFLLLATGIGLLHQAFGLFPSFKTIATSLLILSIGLIAMAAAMKILSTVDMDTFDLLVIFAGGLGSMVVALMLLAKVPVGTLLAAAGAIAIISVSMMALSFAMAILANFQFSQLISSMGALVITIVALSVIAGVMGTQIAFIIAGAVGILAILAAIGGGLAIIGLGFKTIGNGILTIANGLKELSAGVMLMSMAITESVSKTFTELQKNANAIRSVLLTLSLMSVLAPGIILLGASIAILGAGLLLVSTAANLFATALAALSKFMITFATSLKFAGDTIIKSKEQISAFVGLILKLALLSLVTPFLFIFATGLIAVGAALMVFGAGLTVTMAGLALFAVAMEKLSNIDWASIGETISKIWEGITNAVNKFIDWLKNVDWSAVWSKIVEALKKVWVDIQLLVQRIAVWIILKLGELWDKAKEKLGEVWDELKEKAGKLWDDIKEWFSTSWDNLLKSFDDWKEDIKEKGRNILAGFLEGLQERWDDIKGWPGKVRDAVLGGLDSGFDIASPSKEMWYRGLFAGEGFNNGLDESLGTTDGIIDGFADKTLGKFGGLGSKIASWFGRDLPEATEISENSLSELLKTTTDYTNLEWKETIPALQETWDELGKNVQELDDLNEKYQHGEIDQRVYEQASEELKGKILALIGSFEELEQYLKGVDRQINVLTKEQNELGDSFSKGKIPASEFALKLKENSSQLKTLKEIQSAYKVETKDATKATDEESKALDKNTESTTTNTTSKSKATKAEKDFAESLTSTLQGQMNIFSKFEAKQAMSKQTLLENMKSQIQGMTNWAASMNKLSEKGIDQALYKKLAEMGVNGAEYVAAFNEMTAEELAQANEMWAQSLVLPGDIAKQIGVDFDNIGKNIGAGLSGGIDSSTSEVEASTREMVNEGTKEPAMDELEEASPSKVFYRYGFYIDLGLANGITLNMHFPIKAMETMCMLIVDKAKQLLDKEVFYPIGQGVVEGVAEGINQNISIVETAVRSLASLVESAARSKEGFDVNSPSKRMIPIGLGVGEGLAVGINRSGRLVSNSVNNLSDDTISQMKYTIANIASMINDEMEDPVIRPILDLSNVQAGARTLNSIFGTNQTLKSGAVTSDFQNRQSGNVVFNQYNTSPKSLSRIEIYRDTRNILSQYRQAIN